MDEENTAEIETTKSANPALVMGTVSSISLSDIERKIVSGLLSVPYLTNIQPYLNQILNDGKLPSNDIDRINDYLIDWSIDNPDAALPQPLVFIQTVLIPRLSGEGQPPEMGYTTPSDSGMSPQQQLNAKQPSFEQLVDEDNLPSYLPKIHGIIEAEVRRRVRLETKKHQELQKLYDELVKRFENISNLFTKKSD